MNMDIVDRFSKNIVFLLEYTPCPSQYTGKSEWPLNFRINNYTHSIKSLTQNNFILVEQFFHLTDYNIYPKFT